MFLSSDLCQGPALYLGCCLAILVGAILGYALGRVTKGREATAREKLLRETLSGTCFVKRCISADEADHGK